MKAQLVKRQDRFDLYNESDGSKIASTLPNPMGKLSIANCEAIANGYDLDELACNEIGIDISVINHIDNKVIENDSVSTPIHEAGALGAGLYHRVKGFEIGFQKAVEILGDKKFSEFLDKEKELGISDIKTIERIQWYYKTYFDKSQQTEFDVVVEMDIDNPCPKCGEKDNVHGNYGYSNITRPLINTLCNECGTYFSPIPKLDADGCIVLKRK